MNDDNYKFAWKEFQRVEAERLTIRRENNKHMKELRRLKKVEKEKTESTARSRSDTVIDLFNHVS